jgi:hypothetical protein
MSQRNRCEVCGSTDLVTTFSRIDMQQVCAACESTYSTYFLKDGSPFSYPATWGHVLAVEVETNRVINAYAETARHTERMADACHLVLEGRLNEEEGLAEIQRQYKEMIEGKAPSYPVEQLTYYIFSDDNGTIRRARIAKGYFDTPQEVKGGGHLDAYHYWVVDVLPHE